MTPGLKPEKNQNNSPVKPYRIWPSKTALAKSPTNIQLNKTPLENTQEENISKKKLSKHHWIPTQ